MLLLSNALVSLVHRQGHCNYIHATSLGTRQRRRAHSNIASSVNPPSTAAQPRPKPAAPPAIRAIITDVDGTLLNPAQQLTQRTVHTLNAAVDAGVPVVLATGKARGPWVQDVAQLQLQFPTVFLQGLLIYAPDGTLMHSHALEPDVCRKALAFAEEYSLTVTVYSDDRILCAACDQHTDRLLFYREPCPEPMGDLTQLLGQVNFHKILLMGDDAATSAARPILEATMQGAATITTALPGMLEVLPRGASKAQGVSMVLPLLGVTWDEVLAAGDGENDLEMLAAAGWAVAMGNASETVQAAANFVTATNDHDGLAAAVERFVLQQR